MRPPDEPPREIQDRMLRQLLLRPANLADFLRHALPALADGFRFEEAQPLAREAITEDWRVREGDLPFLVPYRWGEGRALQTLVCLLLEHQSSTDALVPLRQLFLTMSHWGEQWEQWERGTGGPLNLHPVVPVVLHTGPRLWGGNRTLSGLCDAPAELLRFMPTWEPVFWDLAAYPPEELLAGGPFLQLLAVMGGIRREALEFMAVWRQALARVASLADGETVRWQELMQALLGYGLSRRPRGEDPVLVQAVRETNPRREEEVTVMAETILEHRINLARPGIERQARAEALRAALRRSLASKFGPLGDAVITRIEEIDDPGHLEDLVVQAAQATSLEGVQL